MEERKTVPQMTNTNAVVAAPPAKAHTLRAILLASLADGTSVIRDPLLGEDQLHLIDCLTRLGVKIEKKGSDLTIRGTNGRFTPVNRELDVGESGVAMNTLTAVASLVPGDIVLTGAPGLLARPVGDLVDALRQLGCEIQWMGREAHPPLLVRSSSIPGGTGRVSGIKTSQYFSSLALSAPLARNDVTLICVDELSEKPYFDITLQMMERFGAQAINRGYREVSIPSGQSYRACDYRVEGDWSSASFYLLAAAVCKSTVRVTGLSADTKQGDRLFASLMETMGARVAWDGPDLVVTGGTLSPIRVAMADTPDLVPPLAIAAAFAAGTSVFAKVGHLRYKECNRLEAIKTELGKMGIRCEYDDDLVIHGDPSALRPAVIDSWNDHRIAMSFAVAGLALGGVEILNPGCVSKSFPDFWERIGPFWG